jgi:hypothetical protein
MIGLLDCWMTELIMPTIPESIPSSLPLFVAFVAANDADDAFAPHDFAVFTKFLDRRANFHS